MTLTDQLADLDPARGIPDAVTDGPAARDLLARLLAHRSGTSEESGIEPAGVDEFSGGDREHLAPAHRPHRARRRLLLAGAAAATLTAVLTVQMLRPPEAYATWTATPRPATPAELDTWGTQCLENWAVEDHDFSIRLAEVRGDFTYVVLGAPDGFEATCLTGADLFGVGFLGPLEQTPAPDALVTNGVRDSFDDEGYAEAEVTGRAGSDVVALTVDGDGTPVHATLHDGHFAAWWPLSEPPTPGAGLNPNVTITLADGTSTTRPINDFNVMPR
jgi:hypothetical protein